MFRILSVSNPSLSYGSEVCIKYKIVHKELKLLKCITEIRNKLYSEIKTWAKILWKKLQINNTVRDAGINIWSVRMEENYTTKRVLNYIAWNKRNVGRPIKDGLTIEDFMGWNNFWGWVSDDDDSEQPLRHSCHNICLCNKYILLTPRRVWIFSLFHSVQTGPGAHPASYPMDTGVLFH